MDARARAGVARLSAWLSAVLLSTASTASAQTELRSVSGTVIDQASGQPIADATVILDGRTLGTDARGFFAFDDVAPGLYELSVQHLAYGVFTDEVRVGELSVRLDVFVSPTAITLDPIEVVVESRDRRQARVAGTRNNVVTRDEIEASLGTADNVGSVLAQHVPGVRIRNQRRSGTPTCVEFRAGRSLLDPLACHPPVVVLDGVRISDPSLIFLNLPLESIQRMQVIPPGEAGVLYGTDSQYGVLLIETRTGGDTRDEPRALERRGSYDWSAESEPYPWAKVYGAAFLANAAGLALGVALARDCLTFEGLGNHFLESDCGTLGTAGARIALVTLPVAAVTFGANRVGGTELSRGRLLETAVGALLIGVPGYVIATAGEADAFAGADWFGGALLLLGVPAATTLADRLFRSLRD